MAEHRIRIWLTAFDHRVLDAAAQQIAETASRTGAVVAGPVPLPTRIRKKTVNRSPFIDKDSRDQWEIRKHTRLVDIIEAGPRTVEQLTKLQLGAGVHVNIRM